MPSRIRSFVAIDIAPAVLQAVARDLPRLAVAAPGFQWVTEARMHITLNFLGDIPDRDLPEICQTIERVARRIEEFEIEVVGLGAFPHAQRPRVIWAGVEYGRIELAALQSELAVALHKLGFTADREVFSPHLTLARASRDGGTPEDISPLVAEFAGVSFGVSSVDEVILYASYREKTGPQYVRMGSFDLAH